MNNTITINLTDHAHKRICERQRVKLSLPAMIEMLNNARLSGYISQDKLLIPFLSCSLRIEPVPGIRDGYAAVTVLSGCGKINNNNEKVIIWT